MIMGQRTIGIGTMVLYRHSIADRSLAYKHAYDCGYEDYWHYGVNDNPFVIGTTSYIAYEHGYNTAEFNQSYWWDILFDVGD